MDKNDKKAKFYAKDKEVLRGSSERRGRSKEDFKLYDFLPSTEFYASADFSYALNILYGLKRESGFVWLAELFSIVGYERLIQLCTYAGGETIKIPTIDELLCLCLAMQKYSDVVCKGLDSCETLEELKGELTVLQLKEINQIYETTCLKVEANGRRNYSGKNGGKKSGKKCGKKRGKKEI